MLTRRLLLPVMAGAALEAQQQPAARPAGEDPPFRMPEGVELLNDLVYATYGSRRLHLDLYLPQRHVDPGAPVVVYIHGGGWRGGNKNAFRRQAAHMATRGFAGACIEYRLSGEATWPAAIYDAKAAVRFVRAGAKKYGLNADRVGAAGGSAGGHLVALLGTTAHRKDLEGDGGQAGFSSAVRAVAAFNPAVDLVAFGKAAGGAGAQAAGGAVTTFLGKPYAADPALWELATPLTHVSAQSARFLFLHGTGDTTVPFDHSTRMRDKLKAAGVPADVFSAEGAGHGFFNRPPWFEPTLARMQAFFERELL